MIFLTRDLDLLEKWGWCVGGAQFLSNLRFVVLVDLVLPKKEMLHYKRLFVSVLAGRNPGEVEVIM